MSTGDDRQTCRVCPRGCRLAEGQIGACRARGCASGKIVPLNYGRVTSLALDPIEKKPLARFLPGSRVLSVGSFGCNLFCPFCQNHEISQTGLADGIGSEPVTDHRVMTPQMIRDLALELEEEGNIGVAFTYNEPLVGFEFVRDTAALVREVGMRNVFVTNGCVTPETFREVLPFADAMNIDLKAFTEEGYARLGGNLAAVRASIESAAACCHVEVTSLIVPGLNDDVKEMDREAAWLSSVDPEITLHITRYFPRYRMTGGEPTGRQLMERLRDTAGKHLRHVLLGNI
ncbi:MAG: AmmeMemoRadiSam system radical SAM enzyme [Lachnospiraceae bacterium]|nr:AmmeMemoRadiSam system radical SAM enzyme [Lachnospiraceae bacterium]